MLLPFALLALSIFAVWAPAIRLRGDYTLQPWAFLFAAAVVAGLVSGVLSAIAVVALTLLAAFGILSKQVKNGRARVLFTAVAALLAGAFALHLVPGFNNPAVVDSVRVSERASLFTQYANFDKAAAGLLLFAFFCRRCTSLEEWRDISIPTVVAIGATGVVVITSALISGYVLFDPKLPSFTPAFLAVNLLFTCVAEEVFFRGLVQEGMSRVLPEGHLVPVAISALLFGVAHFAGGLPNVALASIAGFGYALVYDATRRIEAPILTHFGVNAIHFLGFTYPRLAA